MTVPEQQTEAVLSEYLARWLDAEDAEGAEGASRRDVEAEVARIFEETRAIMVLDMSGFSSTVLRHGILHFLAKIHEMRALVVPMVEELGGELVKYIGDDVVTLFPDVPRALDAARRIVAATHEECVEDDDLKGFRVAIGIGHGTFLHVPGHDVWGAEVNRAFKIGEDIANADEILLTRDAHAVLAAAERDLFEQVDVMISGITLTAFRLRS